LRYFAFAPSSPELPADKGIYLPDYIARRSRPPEWQSRAGNQIKNNLEILKFIHRNFKVYVKVPKVN
jgi:hypothetical protein